MTENKLGQVNYGNQIRRQITIYELKRIGYGL